MPHPAHLSKAGLCFAAGELAIAVALLVAVGEQRVSAMLAVASVVTAAAVIAARPLLRPPEDDADDAGGGDPPSPSDPPWWPAFERELRAYESRRPTLKV